MREETISLVTLKIAFIQLLKKIIPKLKLLLIPIKILIQIDG